MSFFDDDDDSQLDSLRAEQMSVGTSAQLQQPAAGERRGDGQFGRDSDSTTTGARAQSTRNGAGSSVTGRGAYYNGDGSTRAGSPQLDRIINEHAGFDDDDEYHFGDEEFEQRRRDQGRLIDRLTRAWNNEIGAPELLKFPKRLVERTAKELASRKALVKRANATEDGDDALYLQASLVATENMRISYVLKSLLRERIYKIEQCAEYYLAQDDVEERMYHNEIAHAESYVELVRTYMNTAAMDAMPEQIARNPPPVKEPDLTKAVFIRTRRACGPVLLPDGSLVNFDRNSQHMLRYSTVRTLLERDEVELI
ncbi:hypothetical protein ACM66B_004177 [Microbotryomycetes sp. NB124-2]